MKNICKQNFIRDILMEQGSKVEKFSGWVNELD